MKPGLRTLSLLAAGIAAVAALSGCRPMASEPPVMALASVADERAKECLARAMYFESNRSSQEGMLAVGSVVMNRVESGAYPTSVCEVVGQQNQFAPGVMTRSMANGRDLAMVTAEDVLAGARHPEVGDRAMFFHQAGLTFPYNNMNYVAVAGGNAFYERLGRGERNGPMTSQFDLD